MGTLLRRVVWVYVCTDADAVVSSRALVLDNFMGFLWLFGSGEGTKDGNRGKRQ
jgi:hypothetical protein